MNQTPILMSGANPTGWKLEELLDQLRNEIVIKNANLVGDAKPAAGTVRTNNQKILKLLSEAQAVQQESLRVLDALGPDQGPLGKPRVGSPAEEEVVKARDPIGW